MNRLLAFFILLFSVSSVSAQKLKEDKVPELVRASFQKLYPDIRRPKWELDKGNYEAEFRMDGAEQSALFDSSGTFLQMEIEIRESELPQPIKDYLQKNYAGQKVSEATRITKANGDVLFEVGIKGRELIFDSGGQLQSN